jgi:catechol 2,3-dioxygenase-like lactoylglutathione lyase family enzyme
MIECTIPVLPVSDLDNSIKFYTERLGFSLDWTSGAVCSVSRGGCHIMLRESDKGGAVWVWIGLASDALFNEFRDRGVLVVQEPKNFTWAYEMKFADPDGNILWLGTESRSDVPVADGTAK